MTTSKDYVLGTHDDEIERLGLQHRAWRERVLGAWRAAGIGAGQTVLDVGCGPGYAALDLAEVVGPTGRVVALDKSERFLGVLDAKCRERGIGNLTTHAMDLDAGVFPDVIADAVWCRWVFSFIANPRALLERMAAALRPGGVIVLHEYFDYATWRAAPRCPELEEFVSAVIKSWQDVGAGPEIALSLLGWLGEMGFEIRTAQPIVDAVSPEQPRWKWMSSFVEIGRHRLVDLGYLTAERSDAIWRAVSALEMAPGARMINPAFLEIVAARPSRLS
jgi:SAM-dependent methyltransferase